MFTGLIKEIGRVKAISSNSEGKELTIACPKLASQIAIDDSVAVNGVCLTAIKVSQDSFTAQAVATTLSKSALNQLRINSCVNLELALRATDRLGGHFVQGHVNATAKLSKITERGKNKEMSFDAPREIFRYLISEGSIAIDGISLTLAAVEPPSFMVSIIPHTYEMTTLHTKRIGDSVNIEVDMMAKYLENFLKFDREKKSQDSDRLKSLLQD